MGRPSTPAGASREGREAPRSPAEVEAEILRQLDVVARALDLALEQGDLPGFFKILRASALPFVALDFDLPVAALYRLCYRILHRLGGISPAVSMAVENHLYMVCGIATLPVASDGTLDRRRREILGELGGGRRLLANTNSHVHEKQAHRLGTRAHRTGSGYRVEGRATYMSLATEADMLIFSTLVDGEGLAVFVTPLKGNPAIEIGPYTFPNAMLDSETHGIVFQDLELAESDLFVSARQDPLSRIFSYQHSWHQALISAIYLGAAARALEEVRKFALGIELADGTPLIEKDGLLMEVGRLAIDHRTALSAGLEVAEHLGEVAERGLDDPDLLAGCFQMASIAKYSGTTTAERIVTAARRLIGGRGFVGGHPIERLSQETMFGPLGPEVGPTVERNVGRSVLREEPFFGF